VRTRWCANLGFAAVLALGCGLFAPSGAQAQRVPEFRNTPYVGVGYVASIPDAFAGGAVLVLTPKVLGGAGLYADFKFTPSSPANAPEYDPTITVDQAANVFADRFFTEKSTWTTIDLALVYAVTPELAVYGGAGYAKERHYQEYFDASQTRGFDGFYWVDDPAVSGTRVNALGGVLLRAGRFLAFQMGVEAKPAGADVGVTIMLPI
jgi:hypothetical protein